MFKILWRFLILTTVLALITGTYTNAQAAQQTQTRPLLWADEFNGDSLASTWVKCHWWSNLYCTSQPNNELQLYTPDNISVSNGALKLQAEKISTPIQYCDRDCRDYYYTSGLVQTGGNDHGAPLGFAFTYGYAEARMKIPAGKGVFPAFWLWPADYQDPPEIDIMEILGDDPGRVYMTYHLPDGSEVQNDWRGADFSQDYHVFAVDWQPNALIWYVDGVERYRWNGTTPNTPMYLILNLAIGGVWAGAPDANTVFPNALLVDYVRVYANEYTNGTPTATATPITIPTTPPTPTPLPTSVPNEPYAYTQIALPEIEIDGTTQIMVGLENIPTDGYSGAEFTCAFDTNLMTVDNLTVTDLFGSDPVVAINGPQGGTFILAVAGSQGKKATTSGTAFTFNAKGLHPGQSPVACQARVSNDDDILTSLPSVGSLLTILGSAPTPTSEPTSVPTSTPEPSPTSEPSPSTTPTALPPSTGILSGQVKASKTATVELYTMDNTLVASQIVNENGTFSLEVLAGTYTAKITSSGFLSGQGQVTLTAGQTLELPPISLLAGDIDGNNVIDQFDALTIGMSYNTAFPEVADLNNDGVINLLDLKQLARNYRQTAPLSWQ